MERAPGAPLPNFSGLSTKVAFAGPTPTGAEHALYAAPPAAARAGLMRKYAVKHALRRKFGRVRNALLERVIAERELCALSGAELDAWMAAWSPAAERALAGGDAARGDERYETPDALTPPRLDVAGNCFELDAAQFLDPATGKLKAGV